MALSSIEKFSGGEKARLALALLVWQAPNLLLLDEPTNHLDLEMRNALTMALQSYQGALVLVSHDRYLIQTATDELFLVANHTVKPFVGDLNDYQAWLFSQREQKPGAAKSSVEKRKLQEQADKLEKQLEKLQLEKTKVDEQLGDNQLYQEPNGQRLEKLLQLQKQLAEKISAVEAQWIQISEQL